MSATHGEGMFMTPRTLLELSLLPGVPWQQEISKAPLWCIKKFSIRITDGKGCPCPLFHPFQGWELLICYALFKKAQPTRQQHSSRHLTRCVLVIMNCSQCGLHLFFVFFKSFSYTEAMILTYFLWKAFIVSCHNKNVSSYLFCNGLMNFEGLSKNLYIDCILPTSPLLRKHAGVISADWLILVELLIGYENLMSVKPL